MTNETPKDALTDPDGSTAARPARRGAGAIGGGLWTILERMLSQGAQLVTFVVAARMLTPAEFGVFALVSTCAILLLRFAEASWQPYIMSWGGDDRVPRQVVMVSVWSGLALGTVGALAGLVLPHVAAALGVGPGTGALVMLFSLWVAIATVSSAQKGMMIWQGGLKASALSEILGDLAGMVVSVAALLGGWGVFALAFGRLAYQSTHLALSFTFTRAVPLPGLRGADLADLLAYTRQSFTSRMIGNLRLYLATFLIGGFLGPAAVGYYRAATRLVGAVAEIIGQPAQILAWNLFRKARDLHGGTRGFAAEARIYFPALLALGAPVFIWLALMGEDLISGLLGDKWLPALPVVAVLALARAIVTPGVATEPILSLAGEIRRLPLFSLTALVVTAVLTLVAAPFGLMAVAWAQVAVSVTILGLSTWLMGRYGGVHWAEVAGVAWRLVAPILIGSAAVLALRDAAQVQALPALARPFVVLLPALPVYVAALAIAEPSLRTRIAGRLRRRMAGA